MTTRRLLSWAALAAILGFVAFTLSWRLGGGRWERVETPSMGTTAPVGSLLWVKRVDFDELQVGDFISFRPPGGGGSTYSHLVQHRNADGSIGTRGVLPGPDPWQLRAQDVVGQVTMVWPGVGWLVTATPVLLAGGLAVALVSRRARPKWRLPVALVLGVLVLDLAIVCWRPFVNAEQLAFAPTADGGANATYVGTGLLPVRLTAHHGSSRVMRAGEVATVHVSQVDVDGRLRVRLGPAAPRWFWLLLVMTCFAPALCSVLLGRRPT